MERVRGNPRPRSGVQSWVLDTAQVSCPLPASVLAEPDVPGEPRVEGQHDRTGQREHRGRRDPAPPLETQPGNLRTSGELILATLALACKRLANQCGQENALGCHDMAKFDTFYGTFPRTQKA